MWDFWDTIRKPNLWIMDKEEGIENIFNKTMEENSQI